MHFFSLVQMTKRQPTCTNVCAKLRLNRRIFSALLLLDFYSNYYVCFRLCNCSRWFYLCLSVPPSPSPHYSGIYVNCSVVIVNLNRPIWAIHTLHSNRSTHSVYMNRVFIYVSSLSLCRSFCRGLQASHNTHAPYSIHNNDVVNVCWRWSKW